MSQTPSYFSGWEFQERSYTDTAAICSASITRRPGSCQPSPPLRVVSPVQLAFRRTLGSFPPSSRHAHADLPAQPSGRSMGAARRGVLSRECQPAAVRSCVWR